MPWRTNRKTKGRFFVRGKRRRTFKPKRTKTRTVRTKKKKLSKKEREYRALRKAGYTRAGARSVMSDNAYYTNKYY